MLYVIFLAHLLGDYLFQWKCIARWKARSMVGVLAHGGIVTITTWGCASLVDASWWPYALLIGLIHTTVDLVRARFLRTKDPFWELVWSLLDQAIHLLVIVLVVNESDVSSHPPLRGIVKVLASPQMLTYAIGYILLLNPAWVLLRFVVRGIGGATAAPHLGYGDKYGPMVERVLIASLVLAGQLHLTPLVLLPRRMVPIRAQEGGAGILITPVGHWSETILSLLLAIAVGLVLRAMTPGG